MTQKIVIDLLNEVRAEQKEQSSILVDMKVDVSDNKKGLDAHMEQTKLLKQLVEDNKEDHDARLKILEEPLVVFGGLKKYLIGAASIAAATLAILKLFNYF